jgi:hypothetical protein
LSAPAFDKLLARLTESGAEFVLIGGLAVNAWGVVRGTKDLDIVVDPDPANLKRIAEVAVAAGGHVQRGEALLRPRATEAEVLGVPVAVCSAADLRAMKLAAGRGQDLLDVENLDAALSDGPDSP